MSFNSRADKQREDAVKLLEEVKTSNEIAKEAVAQGDATLKEANNTYQVLSGFQNKVSESSGSAEAALKTVPHIETEIYATEDMINEADRVSLVILKGKVKEWLIKFVFFSTGHPRSLRQCEPGEIERRDGATKVRGNGFEGRRGDSTGCEQYEGGGTEISE